MRKHREGETVNFSIACDYHRSLTHTFKSLNANTVCWWQIYIFMVSDRSEHQKNCADTRISVAFRWSKYSHKKRIRMNKTTITYILTIKIDQLDQWCQTIKRCTLHSFTGKSQVRVLHTYYVLIILKIYVA